MCSLATSTMSTYSAELVRRVTSGTPVLKTATGGGATVPSAAVIASNRATASA